MIGLRLTLSVSLALVGLVIQAVGEAQEAVKTARIGYLDFDAAEISYGRRREAFFQGLRDLGYVEGRNLLIEHRDAKGKPEQLPALAGELVRLQVDVIVASGGTAGTMAAKRATTTIPIVFPAVGNPVADGLVASLARPGGNVTGLSVLLDELIGKRLELIRQVRPGVSRVAFLLKPDSVPERTMKEVLKAAGTAARALGMRLQVVEARSPQDFDRAFSDMVKARAGAVVVNSTPVFESERRRLVELAAKNRLPALYSWRTSVDAGGLMSYGPDLSDMFRRAATYVDKILKGTKPGDLPVEQPTKFELVINLETARALGLTIPQEVLARADHVIDK